MVPIDAGSVPEGWQAIGIRVPHLSDTIIVNGSPRLARDVHEGASTVCLIIRKIHEWPDWLNPGWVAVDASGHVYWFPIRPAWASDLGTWETTGGSGYRVDALANLDLPAHDDPSEACWRVGKP